MATKSAEQLMEENDARLRLSEKLRDLLSVKVTIPLGDTKLKEVHTNTFIWLPLLDYVDYANYEDILKYLYIGSGARNSLKYIRDRWYVEACNITNDSSGKFQMELTLNPLASLNPLVDGNKYSKNAKDWEKAFTDALNNNEADTSTNTGNAVSSTSGNSTLTGGQGTTIDNLVKQICGSETDQLKKAKLIHGWLQDNVRYSYYECTKYNTPEKCYNNRSRLNCADTARLTTSMMRSAGLNAYVVHRTTNGGHFWTIIEIGGKKYASDQTGSGSAWNTVWARSGRTTVSNGGSYTRKNGANPDC